MNERERDREPDLLVRRVLDARAERVDADAFLERIKLLQSAKRRRVWIRRCAIGAVAACLLAAALVVAFSRSPREPAPPSVAGGLLALDEWEQALRSELSAAWEGARCAGSAVVSVGSDRFQDLRRFKPSVPALPGVLKRGAGILPLSEDEEDGDA